MSRPTDAATIALRASWTAPFDEGPHRARNGIGAYIASDHICRHGSAQAAASDAGHRELMIVFDMQDLR